MDNDLAFIISERKRLWNVHPIITESAILPTLPIQNAIAMVLEISRKTRGSIAFCADPLSGKSSCLRMIKLTVEERILGCGVLMLEAVEDDHPAEGRLLAQILKTLGYVHKIDATLAGKRDQVKRALIALSGEARHIFILIDEAQDFCIDEFAWLKAVINSLSMDNIKVTTVLFGQRELQKKRKNLNINGRSDLGVRFMKRLIEFKRCKEATDLLAILIAVDNKTKFPLNTSWTYTQLLFPKAYANGFRFAQLADNMWKLFIQQVHPKFLLKGLSMEVVAATLAQICLLLEHKDVENLVIPEEVLKQAIVMALEG